MDGDSRRRTPLWVIGLEGVDGVGKSTAARVLVDALKDRGLRTAVAKIGGGRYGHEPPVPLTGHPGLDFEAHLITRKLEDQCAAAHRAAASADVLVYDRTYLSHVLGVARRVGLPVSAAMIDQAQVSLCQALPALRRVETLVFLQRPSEQVLSVLHERLSAGHTMGMFEQLALDQPALVEEEQRRLEHLGLELQADRLDNPSDAMTFATQVRSWLESRLPPRLTSLYSLTQETTCPISP